MNERLVLGWLAGQKGRGQKERITTDQRTKIAALSQEPPEKSGVDICHGQSEHSSVDDVGVVGLGVVWSSALRTWREGQERRVEIEGESQGVFGGPAKTA